MNPDVFFFLCFQREKTWVQKLEEAKRERSREAAEVTCQTDEVSSLTVSAEELDSRLRAQKQQLQLDADKVQHKAVEEARKQVQRELEEKHLEDMAKQVTDTLFITTDELTFVLCVAVVSRTHMSLKLSTFPSHALL